MGKCKRRVGIIEEKGITEFIQCIKIFRMIEKDKAIKLYQNSNIVDALSKKGIANACIQDEYTIFKLFLKVQYCIACALSSHFVHPSKTREKGPLDYLQAAEFRREVSDSSTNAAVTEPAKVAEAVAKAQTYHTTQSLSLIHI
eukprot:TRINITY_DN15832_c0_g1_i2.p1 TRINITY_DN15832_c0_g1~~TRINITY_DN15832_c0_g1_i2.p1  ORF type:complete len:154 (-),score=8.29 TRINITY_DN15832_c0_g1_i2:133-561(-)